MKPWLYSTVVIFVALLHEIFLKHCCRFISLFLQHWQNIVTVLLHHYYNIVTECHIIFTTFLQHKIVTTCLQHCHTILTTFTLHCYNIVTTLNCHKIWQHGQQITCYKSPLQNRSVTLIKQCSSLNENKNETYNRSARVQVQIISKYFLTTSKKFSWSTLLYFG